MANPQRQRGNGATSKSLAGQFAKCGKCNIKFAMTDLETWQDKGTCPLGCPIAHVILPNAERELIQAEAEQAKKASKAHMAPEGQKQLWVAIETPEGNTYYHNTQSGVDQWQKPPDFGATYKDGPGLMQFPDRTLDILRAEQTRVDAARMGIKIPEPQVAPSPLEGLEDRFRQMEADAAKRGAEAKDPWTQAQKARSGLNIPPPIELDDDAEMPQLDGDDDDDAAAQQGPQTRDSADEPPSRRCVVS